MGLQHGACHSRQTGCVCQQHFFQGRSNEKDIKAILRHKGSATTENYIARMFPRENVFESALVKTERLETQQRFEPKKSEVPHGSPHFEWSSVKLQ